MFIDILIEILKAIGRFFMNPLLYVAIVSAVFLGYQRVKRERKHFHRRLWNGWTELATLLRVPVSAFVISVVIVAVGLTVHIPFLLLLTAVSIVCCLTYTYQLASPIVTWTAAFLLFVAMHETSTAVTIGSYTITGMSYTDGVAVSIAAIAALLLFVEGRLIQRHAARLASPRVQSTKRGMKAVAFQVKTLWLLPLLLLVPGDVIDTYTPWWPQLTLGSTGLSLVLFPAIIGFQQTTRKTLPLYVYPQLAANVKLLSYITLAIAIGAYFEPLVALIGLPLVAVGRLVIGLVQTQRETTSNYAVVPSDLGVMIIAVLPDSPAEKMGLTAGEIIKRVNGQSVKTENELYEALQINAAHCRLEVLNHSKEIRLTQHVVHTNDNYKIGIITF